VTALAPAPLASPGPRDALEPAVLRLHARFAGIEVEVVRRVLEDSYDRLLARATVTSFLVILAERTAAARLRGLLSEPGTGPGSR
jgi:arsenate reductase